MKKYEYINSFCTGCGMCCSSWQGKLQSDSKGFPNVKLDQEIGLEYYERVCPVFHYAEKNNSGLWGDVAASYIGYSSDDMIRYKAASGGALTELSIFLLENDLVDGIIHTTFRREKPTETMTCISYTRKELIDRCGSRYSISAPLENILQIIDDQKRYAFIGKPCDVMALKRYMQGDEKIKEIILYTLSFFCAGEPSATVQEKLLQRMGCSFSECEAITYRGNGWPGFTTVTRKDGSMSTLSYTEAWGEYLGRDIRKICRYCLDGTGDAADIVCADFWQLNSKETPDFSEHPGRNIIICRNDKGNNVVKGSIGCGKIVCEDIFTDKMEEFHLYQPHQYRRKSTMKSMIIALKLCGKKAPKYDKTYLDTYSSYASFKEKTRAFLGICKRVIYGRI